MLRFRVLGPLEVWDGAGWREIGSPKWRAVLAALLINNGQVVSTDTLIEAAWGDEGPAKAANLISIYVLRLRRLIGGAAGSSLVTRAPGYQLRVADDETDAGLFEAMVRDSRRELSAGEPERAASQLAEALALWRGSPLADVPRSALVEAEADRLAELKLDAVELRVIAELACGSHAQVIPELRRVLADNPLREGLWLLLMRALVSSGRHAEALDVYGRARAVISDELGVDPGAELRRFYAQMLAASDDDSSGHAAALAPHQPADPVPARIASVAEKFSPGAEPRNVTGCESFSRELDRARTRTGLTVEEAAKAAGISPGAAHDLFSGHTLPACSEAGLKTLRALLAACGITGLEQVIAWTDALARAWPEAVSAERVGTVPGAATVPDSPGFDLCPDPLTARTAPELVRTLARFRLWAGEPSFREMERACGHAVAAATMCTALKSDNLPSLQLVLAVVSACGGAEDHQQAFATAWRTIRMTHDSGSQRRRMLYPIPDTA
jgi:DNA-binding SARP family transcriptional activator/transcriptional regulator with XRE-family HTH domain